MLTNANKMLITNASVNFIISKCKLKNEVSVILCNLVYYSFLLINSGIAMPKDYDIPFY